MADTPEAAAESDAETVSEPKETEPPARRISLQYGEQSVEVVGPDDLPDIADTAAKLWALITPARPVQLGFTAGSTLYTERGLPYQGEPDEQGFRL